VREALENLQHPSRLAQSPLAAMCAPAETRDGGQGLQRLLVELIDEIAGSTLDRDAEAARILRAYYVKKVGSQETVAERLHLARATFYRRLHRGWDLLAERLDQVDGTNHRA
jgi:transcriptional regulator of acetoin/glycerol metabolism